MISDCKEQGLGRLIRYSREEFRAVGFLYNIIMVDSCPYTLTKTYRMCNTRVSPNVNYGLWMIITGHCCFIDYDKCTTLLQSGDMWYMGLR
jgi:hypothetical protein